MALTVDDGTFETGNTFVDLVYADAFHLERNNTEWAAATDALKESALIRMFDFLSVKNWKSTTFDSGIPDKLKKAQCIGALKELQEAGAVQPDLKTGIKKEALDDVVSIEYFEGREASGVVFTAIENLIRPYLYVAGSRIRLVRGGG